VKMKTIIQLTVLIVALGAMVGTAHYFATRTGAVEARATVDPSTVKIEEAPDTNVIEVDQPDRFKLVPVTERPAEDQLHVTGSISPDVSRTVPVISMASGRVVDIAARLGDQVSKGQRLLTISSPDLAGAFSDYQKFVADETLARRQLERSQLLYARGAIAEKDLQVAEDADQKAKVDLSTAAERVRILGGDVNHPSSLLEVFAPVSGVIVEQNVTGSAGVKSLDNSPNLFTIADLSRVWVLCDVYENDLSRVHLGQIAQVRLNAYPDRVFRASISNIGQVLDANTRTAKVRLEVANPNGLMRPNMFGTITFFWPGRNRPVVPASAVLRLHDKSWVFVMDGPNRFRRLEVQVGSIFPDRMQEIIAGVKPGDEVVQNALALSSTAESNR
jgi:membrane fusion protein, heavy metal efflux system